MGDITTLGRGGSDTTAVAMAAALKADECQIFTDVDGVYTTDPRALNLGRKLDRITFEECLRWRASVPRCCRSVRSSLPANYNVPLRVLSSFEDGGAGTLITLEEEGVEAAKNCRHRVQSRRSQTDDPRRTGPAGVAYKILGPIGDANVEVDMIVQNIAKDGTTDFTFTVNRSDYKEGARHPQRDSTELECARGRRDNKIVKISLVGVGMRSHAGIASKMFARCRRGINIR